MKVMRGETRGYTRHPQVLRWNGNYQLLTEYMQGVRIEMRLRGWKPKALPDLDLPDLDVQARSVADLSSGQLEYETNWLRFKLADRGDASCRCLLDTRKPTDPHPMFKIVPGPIADWERAD